MAMSERSRRMGWALACLAGAGLWAARAEAATKVAEGNRGDFLRYFGPMSVKVGSLGGSSTGAGGPNRWAVVVGINRYTQRPEKNLRGCENDVENMLQILTRLYAFPPENIQVLRNEQATKAAIHDALLDMGRKAGPDDLAVYYHSGHGACVPDVHGDDPDEWDECLLPSDFTWNPEASASTCSAPSAAARPAPTAPSRCPPTNGRSAPSASASWSSAVLGAGSTRSEPSGSCPSRCRARRDAEGCCPSHGRCSRTPNGQANAIRSRAFFSRRFQTAWRRPEAITRTNASVSTPRV